MTEDGLPPQGRPSFLRISRSDVLSRSGVPPLRLPFFRIATASQKKGKRFPFDGPLPPHLPLSAMHVPRLYHPAVPHPTNVSGGLPLRLGLLLLLSLGSATQADLALPAYFSDHMMLQAETPAPIWGWADPGESVAGTFAGQTQTTQANDKGEWRLTFNALKAGANGPLTLKGKNNLTCEDVLAGEVWLASGQSNMHVNLAQLHRAPGVAEALASSDDPWVRQFTVIRNDKVRSARELAGAWRVANKESLTADRLHGDSATAYFFARETRRRLNRPVGILHASIGATPIETWSEGGSGFESMVKHLTPYGIRGFLWYQGESNVQRFTGALYTSLLTKNVALWRSLWGAAELPFLYVQIAPHRYSTKQAPASQGRPISPLELPLFWEAQSAALKTIPRSGMAVIHDSITDLENIHPENKRVPGERLALLAATMVYGYQDVIGSGPLFESTQPEGSKIRIRFSSTGSGLATRNGDAPDGFEIAGEDRHFVPATVSLEKDCALVSSPQVSNPVAVRFGWSEEARPNLMNKEGLPAAPFRTDSWLMDDPRTSDQPASK
jgi:sialate O-acetylesterase